MQYTLRFAMLHLGRKPQVHKTGHHNTHTAHYTYKVVRLTVLIGSRH